jgi:hypothetical protein
MGTRRRGRHKGRVADKRQNHLSGLSQSVGDVETDKSPHESDTTAIQGLEL